MRDTVWSILPPQTPLPVAFLWVAWGMPGCHPAPPATPPSPPPRPYTHPAPRPN